ncbi:MAG TPA: NADH-quinone oxidoreductase subunit C [Thermoleophilia bacterium]|nr:NADH-quinone oxidoreductase subunit C [Thermoleophilia bacterium]
MDSDAVLQGLGVCVSRDRRTDGDWAEIGDLDVRAMTRELTKAGARWVTMTVTPAGNSFRLIYHWDMDGRLLNVATTLTGPGKESIADLLPAAEWVEREMHDYYALEFFGRDETPALMLRPGDEPGLFSRTQELGRDGDPAEYEGPAGDGTATGPGQAASSEGAVA